VRGGVLHAGGAARAGGACSSSPGASASGGGATGSSWAMGSSRQAVGGGGGGAGAAALSVDLPRALALLLDVARGMAYLHARWGRPSRAIDLRRIMLVPKLHCRKKPQRRWEGGGFGVCAMSVPELRRT
jgi:hypothetical protein